MCRIEIWKCAALLWLAAGTLSCVNAGEAKTPVKEPDKLDLSTVLEPPEDAAKAPGEEMETGDHKEYTVVTDDDTSALAVGDRYRSDDKTYFTVAQIPAKGAQGGSVVFKRTHGKEEPSNKYIRMTGKGPSTIAVRITLLDLYKQGGPFLHPIAFLLMLTIVLAINSFWIYRRRRQIPPVFVESARQALDSGDLKKFEDLALAERGLFAQICRALVDRFDTSTIEEIRGRVEIAAGSRLVQLKIPVKALNLISVAAPLLGLLGTIVGMVIVFESVSSSSGAAKATALAAGIRVKLFSTAFALVVAIPSLFLYFIFNQKLSSIVAECEDLTERFMHKIALMKRGAAPVHISAPAPAPVHVSAPAPAPVVAVAPRPAEPKVLEVSAEARPAEPKPPEVKPAPSAPKPKVPEVKPATSTATPKAPEVKAAASSANAKALAVKPAANPAPVKEELHAKPAKPEAPKPPIADEDDDIVTAEVVEPAAAPSKADKAMPARKEGQA